MIDAVASGKRLTELRGIRTRTGVAAAVGCSDSALQAYESGARIPRDQMKCKIADYYGVSVQSIWFPEK